MGKHLSRELSKRYYRSRPVDRELRVPDKGYFQQNITVELLTDTLSALVESFHCTQLLSNGSPDVQCISKRIQPSYC